MSRLVASFPVHSLADALDLAEEIPVASFTEPASGYGSFANDDAPVFRALRKRHPRYPWHAALDRTGERSRWMVSPVDPDPRDVTSPLARLPRLWPFLDLLREDQEAGRRLPGRETLAKFLGAPWWWVEDDDRTHVAAHEYLRRAQELVADQAWLQVDADTWACPSRHYCRTAPSPASP